MYGSYTSRSGYRGAVVSAGQPGVDGRRCVDWVGCLEALLGLDEERWLAAGCGVDLDPIQVGVSAEEVDVVVVAGMGLL